MFKKRVHDLLFLAHKFHAFFQTVSSVLDIDDGAAMQNTVQDGGGDGNVGKDLAPQRKGLLGSKYGRGFLILSGNELEEKEPKS